MEQPGHLFQGSAGVRFPWHIVAGFGAHLKATKASLVITRNGHTDVVSLDEVDHLILMGGHYLHTSVANTLLRSGKSLSFFEADGEPLGVLRPYGHQGTDAMREAQQAAPIHGYALKIAQGALIHRIRTIEILDQQSDQRILYEGEIDIIRQNLSELQFLVRVDEIRRVHRLVSDMYYEIIARTVPAELGFRRRTSRPYTDVVNSILAVGYGMLFGNACAAAIGADLDPDTGFLHKGRAGLIYDLIEPFKTGMIDLPMLELVRSGLEPRDYECSTGRCILSQDLFSALTQIFHASIRQDILDQQVFVVKEALLNTDEFRVVKC